MKKSKLSFIKYWLLSNLLKTNSEKGYVLVVAMTLLFGLAGLVLVYARTSRIEQVSNTATIDSSSGFYAAEGALNERANEITAIYQNSSVPNGTSPKSTTACFDNNSLTNGTGDFQCETHSYSGGDAERSGYTATTYVLEKNNGVGTVGNVPPGDNHAGLNMIEYGHSVVALAFKDSDVQRRQQLGSGQGLGAIAILQMDIKNRLIPLFQFAAFYKQDLEIFPGAAMTLNGPVHTNANLYIGGRLQAIRGEVTTSGNNLYRAKKEADPSPIAQNQYESQVKTPFNIPSLRVGIESLGLPKADFLTVDGEYFQKADIRIRFTPSATDKPLYEEDIPFTVEVVERTTSSNTLVSVPVPVPLSEAQRRSLRQPILVSADLASIPPTSESFNNTVGHANYVVPDDPNFSICQARYGYEENGSEITPKFGTTEFVTTWENLTDAERKDVAEFAHKILVERVQRQLAPVLFSDLDRTGGIPGLTFTGLNIPSIPLSAQLDMIAKLNSLNPHEIASLPYRKDGNIVQRCFIPAPLIDIGRDDSSHNRPPFRFINSRENNNSGRDMRLLQINMKSLVVWNKEGEFWDASELKSTNQLLFKTAPEDNTAPANSFQAKGMAARDTSDDGLVIYATIDSNIYTNAQGNTSPYGFVIVEGNQLPALGSNNTFNQNDPTGVTFATDQAIYVQGDYNTRNKQPAAIMADSVNVLSNKCFDDNKVVHRLNSRNCRNSNTSNNATLGNATMTVVNAAFLGGNDITKPGQYNGGLENYPRFHEDWSGVDFRYRGSFVSLNVPNHVSGKWPGTGGNFYNPPRRRWDYDLAFNDAKNLPPLTPRFSAMKQESFIRSFSQ